MRSVTVKKLNQPDESRPFGHGRMDLVHLGAATVGRSVLEPGWRWSSDVKPLAGTDTCEVQHALYVLSGRMVIRMDDGRETELGAGDFAEVPPGHDAWVVGDEPCVALDVAGASHYAESRATLHRDTELGTPPRH